MDQEIPSPEQQAELAAWRRQALEALEALEAPEAPEALEALCPGECVRASDPARPRRTT